MQLNEKQKLKGWKVVEFGEIAKQISERVNPAPEDSSRYIGLEHLDSGSIRVSRWGTDVVLKGQKLLMKKGDILFAKRNAYLKRIALAPFDGIFSAHGMILRPHGSLVIPEFLPFFMQSDLFMERAIAISEGSLSPTIKWKTLARQSFSIPPRSKQEKMINLLNRIQHIRKKNKDSECNFPHLREVIIQKIIKSDYDKVPIRKTTDVIASPVNKKSIQGQLPVLLCNYMDVYTNNAIDDQINFMKATASESEISRFALQKGDVVITKDSEDPKDIAIPSFISEDIKNLVCGYHLVILRPKNNLINGRFLFHLLNSAWARYSFYPYAQGITRYGIVSDAYDKIKIPLPSMEKQNIYADLLDSLNHQFEIIKNRDKLYSSIQMKILNKDLLGD